MNTEPFVITISRQLGTGGSFLGQCLAKRLGIYYMDREIISEVSKRIQLSEEELGPYDEKAASIWEIIFTNEPLDNINYIPPKLFVPNSSSLFQVQSDIINKVADERSAVIIGRGGYHILHNRPRHLSVFLHASIPSRIKRIVNLYEVTEKDALRMIEKYDRERAKFIRQIAEHDWLDACNYHLSIDSGVIGLDNAEEMIINYARNKFGAVETKQ
jgi:cytidylate kinase